MKKFLRGIFLMIVSVVMVGCGSETDKEVVRIGVVGENNDAWEFVREQLKEEGITLEIVSFTDYVQPNMALAAGDIDLNAFQTQIFLDDFNAQQNTELVTIAQTIIAPLGIYSFNIDDISELQEGDRVSIPNDATNGGRALLLLQTAGLIKLDTSAGSTPTLQDIVESPLNLDIVELESTQTARSLEDVTVGIINSGLAVDAGFIPTQDAIYLEPVTEKSEPYINVIATNQKNANREVFQTIIEFYQTDEVKEIITETSKGSQIPVWGE